MHCILVRHGIAIESGEWEGVEENRPLTEKGKARVRQVARGLNRLDIKPTHLLTSPFVRAYDTARLLRVALCPSVKLETREELAVGAKPEQLIALLRTVPSDAVVMCVGHEPFLGEIASLWLCGKILPSFPLKKAGVACVEFPEEVRPGHGQLQWWLQPVQLRVIGKRSDKKKGVGKL